MNAYCEALKMAVPSVEKAAQSRDAGSYSLLIAVLLERGGPVTLEDAARRIAAAGVGKEDAVLDSLKRCRPGRPPIYRNGDQYALDPYDDEADLWAFRLGLKPPRSFRKQAATSPAEQIPIPGLDEPLTLQELAEAWRRYIPAGFSQQRQAHALNVPLEVVVGSAPGWDDPWSRARRVRVIKEQGQWRHQLVDEDGGYVYEPEIQAARLTEPGKSS